MGDRFHFLAETGGRTPVSPCQCSHFIPRFPRSITFFDNPVSLHSCLMDIPFNNNLLMETFRMSRFSEMEMGTEDDPNSINI